MEVPNDYPLIRDSIKRVIDAGVIIDAAAGNTNGSSVAYPAAYEGAFSVSAIDETDKITNFSAMGKVDFCALGIDVRSTYLNNGYVNVK